MPEEENKAAARRIAEEVFNEHNVDALDGLLAPDVFNHEAIPKLQHGIGGFKVLASREPGLQRAVWVVG